MESPCARVQVPRATEHVLRSCRASQKQSEARQGARLPADISRRPIGPSGGGADVGAGAGAGAGAGVTAVYALLLDAGATSVTGACCAPSTPIDPMSSDRPNLAYSANRHPAMASAAPSNRRNENVRPEIIFAPLR